ncbi:CENP-Q, a CENPA-CAD centromere complex subunit domain containing protein [Fusarium agapanthi]|uniref:CENP-Q, a CENPA-CAD centromere complex subunit domain containing protein n=1 Tax=Fusarium agapanthi TaxID=1803897 RepID=A0A9P5B8E1_9HYPO|nr:CENP-Q, a CENPA-CAD centromere complex subunit domain containing protein [Fusarium agapanthi]
MTLTDEELDRDWQPSGRRPQSTIARSFSAELMDIFRIENSLTDLDQQVHDKKQTVDKNTEELASLEARIREMEDRLRRSVGGTHQRSPLPQVQTQNTNQSQTQQQQQQQSSSLDAPTDDSKARSRPGTARASQQAPSSGNMPPTPGASEGEYYVFTRDDLQDGPR